jgi:hypothetical protein
VLAADELTYFRAHTDMPDRASDAIVIQDEHSREGVVTLLPIVLQVFA